MVLALRPWDEYLWHTVNNEYTHTLHSCGVRKQQTLLIRHKIDKKCVNQNYCWYREEKSEKKTSKHFEEYNLRQLVIVICDTIKILLLWSWTSVERLHGQAVVITIINWNLLLGSNKNKHKHIQAATAKRSYFWKQHRKCSMPSSAMRRQVWFMNTFSWQHTHTHIVTPLIILMRKVSINFLFMSFSNFSIHKMNESHITRILLHFNRLYRNAYEQNVIST